MDDVPWRVMVPSPHFPRKNGAKSYNVLTYEQRLRFHTIIIVREI